MPLDLWDAFYRQVEADRFRDQADLISAWHAKNPARARKNLLEAAGKTLRQGRPIAADPRRLRAELAGMPGIEIVMQQPDPPAEG